MTRQEQEELDHLLTAGLPVWIPQPGPQTDAYHSQADFLFYGGQAGGGKTDLLIGLALEAHRRSMVFRRQYKQLKAIFERTADILGGRQGFNGQEARWRLAGGRLLEFGSCQTLGDEVAYQGQPHDFIGFDEITHFLESQFRFLCGWNRTTDAGQRCRVVAAGNPPTSAEGEWVVQFWAPWLDPGHSHPALPGALRWFAMLDGDDVEVEGPESFEHRGELIAPKSRSFIPSSVDDNLYLQGSGYKAMLQALPEPLRSQMLKGDFGAGKEDDPWQVIPSSWIKLAQQRWTPNKPKGVPMAAMGVDVAWGGKDETVLTPRYDTWFGEQIARPGVETEKGADTAALVISQLRDAAPVQIDVLGGGGHAAYEFLEANGVQVVAMNGAAKSLARDRTGKLGFFNKRAEWWWRMREALDPVHGDDIALPPDRRLAVDLATPRWEVTMRGIKIEMKSEIVKRLGRSPDRGDSAVYALPANQSRHAKGRRTGIRSESGYSVHKW